MRRIHQSAGWRLAAVSSTLLLLAACAGAGRSRLGPPPLWAGAWRASSAELALTPDGLHLAAINSAADSVTLVDLPSLSVQAEIQVGGQPKAVAVTPDGAAALVTTAGQLVWMTLAVPAATASLDLAGQPYGVVADAQRAYVALFAAGEVAAVDLASHRVVGRVTVEPFPAGLALAGGQLFVTHVYSGQVTVIDLNTFAVQRVEALDPEANLAQAAAWAADGAGLWFPLTLSHAAQQPFQPETAVSPVVMGLRLAGPAAEPARLDLYEPAGGFNLPWAAAASPDGRWLFVANAGTDDVAVLDLAAGRVAGRLPVGRSPRGVVLAPDGRRLLVNNALDGTLSVVDVDYQVSTDAPMPRLSQSAVLTLTALALPPALLEGQRLFYSAQPPLSDGWLSCATCHFEGGHDARTWLGFPDGPRNTPALLGAAHSAPYHWSGDLDELQDVEQTIQLIQGGAGLAGAEAQPAGGAANAGRSAALDALAAYVAALPEPTAPIQADPETLRRGSKAFERWGCTVCHPAPLFTDRKVHELERDRIGSAALQRSPAGLRFDTPSLLGVGMSAPYFHDGSSATLEATLFRAGFHGMGWAMDAAERAALVQYLRSLPFSDAPTQ